MNKADDKSVGVIGFAGSGTVTGFPCWQDPITNKNYYCQRLPDGSIYYFLPEKGDRPDFEEVVTLDGMFLFCRRDVWEMKPFDEEIFTQFHLYDIDFSLTAATHNFKNYVCTSVIISHYSLGSVSKSYFEGLFLFYDKWKSILPYTIYPDKLNTNRKAFYNNNVKAVIKTMMYRTNLSSAYIYKYLKHIDGLKYASSYPQMLLFLIKKEIRDIIYKDRREGKKKKK